MITREQLADLQPGDVVELASSKHPGVVTTGPLRADMSRLLLGPNLIRCDDGSPPMARDMLTLTVVSRAPRPLYVNHPRTEPVTGDVVIPVDHDADDLVTWSYTQWHTEPGFRWRSTSDDAWFDRQEFEGYDLRLLVDGETGQVVP